MEWNGMIDLVCGYFRTDEDHSRRKISDQDVDGC